MAMSTAGAVVAWGDNSSGVLGDGSTTDSDSPVAVSLPFSAASIGAGFFTAYAVASSNLYSWGSNTGGALGTGSDPGTVPYSDTPALVTLPAGGVPVSVTGGNYTGYAIAAGGALDSWGVDDNGALGNGTDNSVTDHNSLVPVAVSLPAGVQVGALAAGLNSGYAIDAPPGSPIITSGASATFDTSVPNTFTVTSEGNPTPSLTATGVPSGVTFTDNGDGTATLAGRPACSMSGKYLINIVASNGSPRLPALQTFTLTLSSPVVTPPVFYSATSDTVTAGVPMRPFAVLTSCNPGTTITSTVLPAGVKLSKVALSHYTLSGTPKTTDGGDYPITFTAKVGTMYTVTQSFTLTVNEKPVFVSSAGLTVVAGDTLNRTVTVFASPIATITSTNPKPWMTLTDNGDNTATLTGTVPSNVGGKFPQTITAVNSSGTTRQVFTLTVDLPPTTPTGPASRTVVHGKLMLPAQFKSMGYPAVHYAYTVVSAPSALTLPTGVSFNTLYGKFSGTPAAGTQGTYVINVTASNVYGSTTHTSAAATFTLTVT
jgi:hypothetical protein